jgi:predicted AAA+ superfamily ATPase
MARILADQGPLRVMVTGSSSRMLSSEVATSLRGRALSTEVLPFSFAEALRHGFRADDPAMMARWGGGAPHETFAALRAAKDNF